MNLPDTESVIRSILKDASDVSKVLRNEDSGTLKVLSIYQYCSSEICNILPWINIEFEIIHLGNSLLKITIGIGEKITHGGDMDLRSGCYQCHQYQYLMKERI